MNKPSTNLATPVTITAGVLLEALFRLREKDDTTKRPLIETNNGLTAYRLTRLGDVLAAEAGPIAIGFDIAGKAYARMTDDAENPEPIVRMSEGAKPQPLSWLRTMTPVYDIAEADQAAYDTAIAEVTEKEIIITVERLSLIDLAQCTMSRAAAEALKPFVEP